MGVKVEVESVENYDRHSPPHPSHMNHPYWFQHVFVPHEEATLPEVCFNLVAASMRMAMAFTPAGWMSALQSKPEESLLDKTARNLADSFAEEVQLLARQARLKSGEFRIIPLQNVQDIPEHCAGIRMAFMSHAALEQFCDVASQFYQACRGDLAANEDIAPLPPELEARKLESLKQRRQAPSRQITQYPCTLGQVAPPMTKAPRSKPLPANVTILPIKRSVPR